MNRDAAVQRAERAEAERDRYRAAIRKALTVHRANRRGRPLPDAPDLAEMKRILHAALADALEAVYADSITGQLEHARWQERAEELEAIVNDGGMQGEPTSSHDARALEWCAECAGPYPLDRWPGSQYGGHWDTCPNGRRSESQAIHERIRAYREQPSVSPHIRASSVHIGSEAAPYVSGPDAVKRAE